MELDWTCLFCLLPKCGGLFLTDTYESDAVIENSKDQIENEATEQNKAAYANYLTSNIETSELMRKNIREVLLIYMNINSLQNKFEELKILNDFLKSHIIFISEMKIDKTYLNQISIPG